MDTAPSSPRHILTYQGATFRRTGYYLIAAGIMVLIIVFVKFPKETPPPGSVAGPPLVDLLLGFAGIACVISAIMEALFVVGVRYGSVKSFDDHNLYITRRSKETVIPLHTITSIRLASGGLGNDIRGTYAVFLIDYDNNGLTRETEICVYRRQQENFNLFKESVQYWNPSVEIRNWSTSLDGLIRLFRRRRN
ncbi:MAG TPA: hypothetical protein VIM64_15080 [Puia sp.]